MNPRAHRAVLPGAAAIIVALALTVMLGWLIHSPALVQVRPTFSPMQFNTALGFLLAALSCLAGDRGRPRPAQVLAGGTLLLGGLTLLQYLATADFGIDQFFITPFTTVKTTHPGRMGPNTALSFVLCGCALLLRARGIRRGGEAGIGCLLLATAATCIGAVALAGYLLGLESAYGWTQFTRMAVHTASAFVLLGGALAWDAWSGSPRERSGRVLPALGGGAVGLIVLLLWGALEAAQERALEHALQRQGEAAVLRLTALLDQGRASLERMRHRLAIDESAQTWQADAADHMRDFPALRALQVSGRPATASWTAVATDAMPPQALRTWYCRASATVVQTDPMSGLFVLESPLQRGQPEAGCLIAFIDLRRTTEKLRAAVQPYLVLDLLHHDRVLGTPAIAARDPGAREFTAPFESLPLKLRAAATPALAAEFRSPLPVLFLVSGLVLAGITAASLLQLQRSQRQARALARAAEELKAEIAQRDALQKTLQAANRRLDDFAYIASHDLKEPLRGLSSLAGFLLDDYGERLDDGGRQRLLMLQAQAQAQRMSALISDLLRYSRAGAGAVAFAPVDLDQLVATVLQRRPPELAWGALQVRHDTPLGTVSADRAQLGMVFECLIDNAAKYSDHNDRKVTIGLRPGPPRTYTVTDNGIGVPEQHRERIFRMFTRLHHREEYGGGSGAGLSIARKIVEAHGGRLWVEARDDGLPGSVFCFTLGDQSAIADRKPAATDPAQ